MHLTFQVDEADSFLFLRAVQCSLWRGPHGHDVSQRDVPGGAVDRLQVRDEQLALLVLLGPALLVLPARPDPVLLGLVRLVPTVVTAGPAVGPAVRIWQRCKLYIFSFIGFLPTNEENETQFKSWRNAVS